MREETTQEVTRGAVEDAVITIDATDTIEEFDSNAVKMFGVPRANAVGKRLSDLFIPPRLRSVHRQAVARQSHQQKPDRLGRHHEGIAMRGDGTEFPVDIAITRSETADRLLFTGVIRDLSDEKRAESRAETENRERQLILDSVGEGICGTDEEGIIIFSNPSAADQLGWNAEELVGQSLFDIVLPAATGGIHPKEGCPIYSVLKKGGVRHVREALFARKDGTVLSVEYTVTSLRERDDKTRGMVLAFREIDIRTKANGIQRLLSSVIEQIGEAVVITDAWGCVQYVNAAFERITGYSRGDALGLDWWKLRIKGGQD
ncbi:MAG: PAS domain S-box protein [Verrucomicrobia bacterium]|nr:PAS domain S-box protein [Verrucomicrobiota bacterium]